MLGERILKKLREERDKNLRLLLDPQHVVNFEHYRFLTGKMTGLTQSIEICVEFFGKDDDDSDIF
jgi:hypothetical protein